MTNSTVLNGTGAAVVPGRHPVRWGPWPRGSRRGQVPIAAAPDAAEAVPGVEVPVGPPTPRRGFLDVAVVEDHERVLARWWRLPRRLLPGEARRVWPLHRL